MSKLPNDAWAVFHTHKKLVDRGLAKSFLCPKCSRPMTIVSHEQDPAFKCYFCDILTVPGFAMYGQARSVVKEYSPSNINRFHPPV